MLNTFEDLVLCLKLLGLILGISCMRLLGSILETYCILFFFILCLRLFGLILGLSCMRLLGSILKIYCILFSLNESLSFNLTWFSSLYLWFDAIYSLASIRFLGSYNIFHVLKVIQPIIVIWSSQILCWSWVVFLDLGLS
jgi:hypothetical protein